MDNCDGSRILTEPVSHGLQVGVPDEIVLQILGYLRLHDILALRETCQRLCAITQDRLAWLHILQEQSKYLPFPSHISRSDSWVGLSSGELELIVRRLHAVNQTWCIPRSHYSIPSHAESCVLDPMFKNDDDARTIYSIDIFLDRWLLCIYHEKMVELWDLDLVAHASRKPVICTSHQIRGAGSFSSAITHINDISGVLTIAVSCHELCHILQVRLRSSSAIFPSKEDDGEIGVQFRTVAIVSFASPIFCLRAIDPDQSLLLLGLPSAFHLLNWETKQRTVVNMLSEEEEELWNGVVGATFLTRRHILVLKAHSLEICTLLDSPQVRMSETNEVSAAGYHYKLPPTQMSAAVHSHFFPGTTFRGVYFSQAVTHSTAPQQDYPSALLNTTVSLTFLAFDVLRGLFQCSVVVVIPPSIYPNVSDASPLPLDVQVRLLSAHNMATPVVPGTDHVPRSGLSVGARGFVSACALGRQGRRGVWVERRRGAVRRVVYVFTAHTSDDDNEGEIERASSAVDPDRDGKGDGRHRFQPGTPIAVHNAELDPDAAHPGWSAHAPQIEGKEIYDVNSYDLRDDITHVTFSETTGLVALGTRKGDIRVLCR